MWLPSIAPTHCGTLQQFWKKVAISSNLSASGVLMWMGSSTLMDALQNAWTHMHTVLTPTPNRWLMVLYSLPVASFHKRNPVHFVAGFSPMYSLCLVSTCRFNFAGFIPSLANVS